MIHYFTVKICGISLRERIMVSLAIHKLVLTKRLLGNSLFMSDTDGLLAFKLVQGSASYNDGSKLLERHDDKVRYITYLKNEFTHLRKCKLISKIKMGLKNNDVLLRSLWKFL